MAKIQKIILFVLLLFSAPIYSFAATLSISANSYEAEVGSTIKVSILTTSNSPINAVSGKVLFPPSFFAVESVSKSASILNFWVTEPTFSRSSGIVQFEGVALGGFSGGTGTVVSVTLKALKAGTGTVSFQSGQILANDGEGTDVTGSLTGATFTIQEAKEKPKQIPKETPVKPVPAPEPEPIIQEEPQRPPSLTAPDIVLGSKFGAPAIIGTSNYPRSQVLLTFISETGTKIFIIGDSDENGGFVLLVPNTLKRGKYTVNAAMIKSTGEHSDTSKDIIIEVGNIFSDVGPEVRWMMVLLVIAVVYLFIRTVFHINSKRHTTRSLRREIKEAENAVHKSFNLLREDVADKTTGRSMRKDLDSAESLIEKEIKDIDQDIEV